jgi:hypothetical protein
VPPSRRTDLKGAIQRIGRNPSRFATQQNCVRLFAASRRLESLGRVSMRLSRSALDRLLSDGDQLGGRPCPRSWPTTTPWTR